MPEKIDGESEQDWMGRCVPAKIDEGMEQEQAVAACMAMYREEKAIDLGADAFKVGARTNRSDRDTIRNIRQSAKQIIDHTMSLEPKDTDDPEPTQEERIEAMLQGAMMNYGGEIKALEDGRIGGYLVKFGSETQTDISPMRDYFTPDTDYGFSRGERKPTPIFFNHRMPIETKSGGSIWIKERIGDGEMEITDDGVLIEAVLYNRKRYEKMLSSLGWSSGTAQHLVDRKSVTDANMITAWPLGLDASITPTPAEPRNNVIPLKSLGELPPVSDLPEVEEGGDAPTTAQPGTSETIKSISTEDKIMDITEERLSELLEAAATKAIKALPAEPTKTGVQVTTDEADQPFKNVGEFFMAVKTAGMYPNQEDVRLRSLKATGANEGIPADGGYLLNDSYASGILERMYPGGSLLGMVSRDEIGPNSNSMTYHGVDESARTAGSRWGGLRGYWLAEAAQITASQPKFKDFTLKLKKVAALCYATDELLDDATALASWLGRTVPQELRFRVEDAIINGDGAGKPLGVLAAPCLVSVTQETSQPADTLYFENIVKMWARRWAGVNDYVWLINQDVTPALDTLALAVGTAALPPNYITYSADGVMRIKGRPVIEVEYCATLGDVGDIILFSPSQYLTIGKGGIQSASSIHVKFDYGETAFRFIYRIDGAPAWDVALTPAVGSNTQSPFVVVETR